VKVIQKINALVIKKDTYTHIYTRTCVDGRQSRPLGVAKGATAPGPAFEVAPRFRPKVVLMSLSSYILR
jgi:hypothetical protein